MYLLTYLLTVWSNQQPQNLQPTSPAYQQASSRAHFYAKLDVSSPALQVTTACTHHAYLYGMARLSGPGLPVTKLDGLLTRRRLSTTVVTALDADQFRRRCPKRH